MEIVGHGTILVIIKSRKVKETWRGFVCEFSEVYRAIDDWMKKHGHTPSTVTVQDTAINTCHDTRNGGY